MSKSKYKILLVDDEPDILEFLKYNFEKENYEVSTAKNGLKALEKAKKNVPDLILLDVMMPNLDGIEVCRLLREIPQFSETLIVFLTARSEDYSEIAGFDVGADDYVTKPIRPRALLARVKSLLKRKKKEKEVKGNFQVGAIVIDIDKRLVLYAEEEIVFPKKEFELLSLLASKPGKVFSREEIFSEIWGNDVIVGDRTIDVHIRKIRRKLGDDSIKTNKGFGYSFIVK